MKRLLVILTIVVMSLLFGCGGGGGSSGGSNTGSVNNSTDSGTGGSTGSITNPTGGTGSSGGTNDSTSGGNGSGTGGTVDTPVSPPAVTIPGAPTGVTVQPGDGQVTISWNPVANATSYNVYWSTTGSVTPSVATRKVGAVSPCVLTGLMNWTIYYFVVTAVNQSGESAVSTELSATPEALFVAEMVNGKTFDYTISPDGYGVVTFNPDGTFTGQNLKVGQPIAGQWVLQDGVLILVYPWVKAEYFFLSSGTPASFQVIYLVRNYEDGSVSSPVAGTFNLK
ncbi:fibronectin type III domain-containing protein [Geoanaerobacter pelophilus]|nr:fibronectin type III domain-containing protein [Geoanaerobacter pelophilus]